MTRTQYGGASSSFKYVHSEPPATVHDIWCRHSHECHAATLPHDDGTTHEMAKRYSGATVLVKVAQGDDSISLQHKHHVIIGVSRSFAGHTIEGGCKKEEVDE